MQIINKLRNFFRLPHIFHTWEDRGPTYPHLKKPNLFDMQCGICGVWETYIPEEPQYYIGGGEYSHTRPLPPNTSEVKH